MTSEIRKSEMLLGPYLLLIFILVHPTIGQWSPEQRHESFSNWHSASAQLSPLACVETCVKKTMIKSSKSGESPENCLLMYNTDVTAITANQCILIWELQQCVTDCGPSTVKEEILHLIYQPESYLCRTHYHDFQTHLRCFNVTVDLVRKRCQPACQQLSRQFMIEHMIPFVGSDRSEQNDVFTSLLNDSCSWFSCYSRCFTDVMKAICNDSCPAKLLIGYFRTNVQALISVLSSRQQSEIPRDVCPQYRQFEGSFESRIHPCDVAPKDMRHKAHLVDPSNKTHLSNMTDASTPTYRPLHIDRKTHVNLNDEEDRAESFSFIWSIVVLMSSCFTVVSVSIYAICCCKPPPSAESNHSFEQHEQFLHNNQERMMDTHSRPAIVKIML